MASILDTTAELSIALLLTVGLSACAGGPGSRNGASPVQLPAGGYVSAALSPVATTTHDWLVDGRVINLLLSEPERPEKLPVIVYVPGLGESSGSGDRWRSTWSEAGYAVVSVQPILEDEMAWSSALARDGDFKALGRERYGADATRRRLDLLRSMLVEAERRSGLGEPGWGRIDWGHAAIAGFDLGAYTALSMLHPGHKAAEPAEPVTFRAVIAVSPYASVSQLAGPERDGLPVLVIGGDSDGDPLGIVEANEPSGRLLDRLQGPDRYVLWMAGLTHANLSGSAAADRAADRKSQASPVAEGDKGGGRRGRKGSSASGSKGPESSGRNDGEVDVQPDLTAADARVRMEQAREVSAAFLDACLKHDARAKDWLTVSARSWLGANGELRRPPARANGD